MDDREDPIAQFFPGQEDVDLYDVLGLTSSAKLDEIKKAYRRQALKYHPDKHTTATDDAKADASLKFQQIGFAYTVLGDEKRRQRYDKTGKTDETLGLEPGEDGWEAYFADLFDRVTKGKLDEMKKEYQGSEEEAADLKQAYVDTEGSIQDILTYIPHSTFDDEARFISIITGLISKGELSALPRWKSSVQDEKARLARKKQADSEAKEAEAHAKELGVWDEFYGSGKPGSRKAKGKGKQQAGADEEEDVSALQALMLKKRKNMDGFFDGLAAKYAEPEAGSKRGKKGKKRAKDEESEVELETETPKKKSRKNAPPPPPDLDDAEFEKIQQRLFGNQSKKPQGVTKERGKKGR